GEPLLPRLRLPHLHCPVRVPRGDAFSVDAEAHAPDLAGPTDVPLEDNGLLARDHVPHPYLATPEVLSAPRGDVFAVGRERHAADPAGVPLEGERLLPPLGVPHLHGLVKARRGEAFTVGAEAHPVDYARVPLESECLLSGLRIPHFH